MIINQTALFYGNLATVRVKLCLPANSNLGQANENEKNKTAALIKAPKWFTVFIILYSYYWNVINCLLKTFAKRFMFSLSMITVAYSRLKIISNFSNLLLLCRQK